MPSTSTENIRCKGLWIRSLHIRLVIAAPIELLRINLFSCFTLLRCTWNREIACCLLWQSKNQNQYLEINIRICNFVLKSNISNQKYSSFCQFSTPIILLVVTHLLLYNKIELQSYEPMMQLYLVNLI